MNDRFDVAVIGSGFAGSILSWILASQGRSVALIDAVKHPRFAIGESSTPIADKLLKGLGERYNLKPLVDMSTYGTWQSSIPKVACGRKRGFSYYRHTRGESFTDRSPHQRSLLVAASSDDQLADTHWFRSDVDSHLFQMAVDSGVVPIVPCRVNRIDTSERTVDGRNQVHLSNQTIVTADDVVDATGGGRVMHRCLATPDWTHRLATKTGCEFGHFLGVASFSDQMNQTAAVDSNLDPFDPDDAAQHHLVDDGWIWMLRMNNGVTSVGHTVSSDSGRASLLETCGRYPSLTKLMQTAKLIAPLGGLGQMERIQRWVDPGVFEHCWMLPSAVATIDPLHSSGIAHALLGVCRLASHFDHPTPGFSRRYRETVFSEVAFLDRLISTAYRTMDSFERFSVACAFYFVAAIRCEEKIDDAFAKGAETPWGWGVDDQPFVDAVDRACDELTRPGSCQRAVGNALKTIAPWNPLGLGNPDADHRYAYTATK